MKGPQTFEHLIVPLTILKLKNFFFASFCQSEKKSVSFAVTRKNNFAKRKQRKNWLAAKDANYVLSFRRLELT
jgi:hypothetical protein